MNSYSRKKIFWRFNYLAVFALFQITARQDPQSVKVKFLVNLVNFGFIQNLLLLLADVGAMFTIKNIGLGDFGVSGINQNLFNHILNFLNGRNSPFFNFFSYMADDFLG